MSAKISRARTSHPHCEHQETSNESFRKRLWFEVQGPPGFRDRHPQVDQALRESSVRKELCLVNAVHITADVFINDDESGLRPRLRALAGETRRIEPVSGYHHDPHGKDDADAHMKRQVMGREVVVAITNGSSSSSHGGQIFYERVRQQPPQARMIKIIGD